MGVIPLGFCFLLCVLVPLGANSQEKSTPDFLVASREDLQFDHFFVENGLSSNHISSLVQDSRGFLWIGTNNGLNKYDGYSFTIYQNDPRDSTSLVNSPITGLYEDRHGILWISTESGGLMRFNCDRNNFTRFTHDPAKPGSLSGNGIGPVYEDGSGTLWIGANGVDTFDRRTETFTNFGHDERDPSSLTSNFIQSILEDRLGNIWVGTDSGLNLLDRKTGKFTHYMHEKGNPRSLSSNHLWAGAVDTSGTLWIGTHGAGLNRFDPVTRQVTHHYRYSPKNSYGLGNDKISVLRVASDGKLWIGTFEGGGLNIFNPYRPNEHIFYRYTQEEDPKRSLSEYRIISLCEDKSGNFWIGTVSGLNKVTRTKRFSQYIPGMKIRSVYVDRQGFLWVGTMGDGLYVFDALRNVVRRHRRDLTNPDSMKTNHPYCFYEDLRGVIWFGSWQGGLNKFDKKTGKFSQYKNTLTDQTRLQEDDVNLIYGDKNGTLRLQTSVGVVIFNPSTETFTLHQKMSRYLYKDSRGIWWYGLPGGGLMSVDESSNLSTVFKHDAQHANSISGKEVNSICEDRWGSLWIGTSGGGISQLDRQSGVFTNYTTKEGLSNDDIHGVLVDKQENVWISTENGLSRLDPGTGRFRNYDISDGLPTNNFYYGVPFMSAGGEVFFPTSNGLLAFYPEKISLNTIPPPIVLTSVSVLNQPISFDTEISNVNEIEITYRQNVFSFEFAALDFTNPDKNQYAYRLEGFNDDWIYSGQRRVFSYTNLDPGTYVMRVRGSNSDGFWNEAGASVTLVIDPPFWLTWWFKTLVALILLGTVVWLYNWRMNKLLEVERARDGIARDLHDDVASTLSSISLFIASLKHNLKKPSRQSADLLEKISQLSLDAVDAMGDVVWSVAPQHDSFNNMITHMRDLASQIFTANGIQYDLRITSAPEDFHIPVDVRKNIYLVFKEAVNNVVKHSGSTAVIVEAGLRDGSFRLFIKDNGSGFRYQKTSPFVGKQSEPQRGHGLRNMKRRASEIGAEFEIVSEPGGGTSITLTKRMT